jgi:hypothetical protein
MNLFRKIFTTRTLVKIIFVLAAIVVMKGLSTHFDFSWATALAADKDSWIISPTQPEDAP